MRSGVSLGTAKKTRAPDTFTSSFPREIPATWSEAEGELEDEIARLSLSRVISINSCMLN